MSLDQVDGILSFLMQTEHEPKRPNAGVWQGLAPCHCGCHPAHSCPAPGDIVSSSHVYQVAKRQTNKTDPVSGQSWHSLRHGTARPELRAHVPRLHRAHHRVPASQLHAWAPCHCITHFLKGEAQSFLPTTLLNNSHQQ